MNKLRSLIKWLSNTRLAYIIAFAAGVVSAIGFKWWWCLHLDDWVQAALRDTQNIKALEEVIRAGKEQKVFCLWGPPCGLKSTAAKELAIKNRAIWLDGNRLRNGFEQEGKKQSLVNYAVPVLAAELLSRYYHVVIDISHDQALNRGGSRGIIWALTLGRRLRFVYVRPKVTLQTLERFALSPEGISPWYGAAVTKRPKVLKEAIGILKSVRDRNDTTKAIWEMVKDFSKSDGWYVFVLRYAELHRRKDDFFSEDGFPKPDKVSTEIDVGMWEESRPGVRALSSLEVNATS